MASKLKIVSETDICTTADVLRCAECGEAFIVGESNGGCWGNIQPNYCPLCGCYFNTKQATWDRYIKYLKEWAGDHEDNFCYGSSPACFDEWKDMEDNE